MSDTFGKASDVYRQRLRQMTPAERVRLGVALWEAGDSLQRAAILHRNPSAKPDEIQFKVAVSRFGYELACKAYRQQKCP